MNKKGWVVIFTFLLIVNTLFIVSAQDFIDVEQGAGKLKEWVKDISRGLFGGEEGGEKYLFEKLLFFFLLMIILYAIISKIPVFADNTAIVWIITIIVALFGTRFLTNTQLVQAVLLPYSVLGVAVLAVIPLIIYFFFVEFSIETAWIRKIAWGVFAAVFAAMAYTQYKDLKDLVWMYLAATVLAIIFALFDSQIRQRIVMSALDKGFNEDKVRQIADLKKKIQEDTDRLATTEEKYYRNTLKNSIKKNKKRIRELAKM